MVHQARSTNTMRSSHLDPALRRKKVNSCSLFPGAEKYEKAAAVARTKPSEVEREDAIVSHGFIRISSRLVGNDRHVSCCLVASLVSSAYRQKGR